jgi:hypothetical protein
MSPTLLRRAVRRPAAPGPAAALAVLGALVLAGCGPGVGGTGTGNETGGLVSYGAAPSSVCATADFASLLDCAPATGSGTAVVYAADGSPTSRHLARFEGSVLTLDLRCSNLRFVGEWASAGQLGTRYFGNVSPTAGTGSAPPASAIVTSQGNTFVVLVQDFSGRRIGEPMLLQRVQAPTQAGGC